MKRPLRHILMLTAAVSAACIVTATSQTKITTGILDRTVELQGLTFRYQVFVPSNYTEDRQWPVILFLHGAGERGDDGLLQTHVGLPAALRQKPSRYPAIVVMPQVPTDSIWTGVPGDAAMLALQETMKEFRTDANRVYLTGLSMGGNGTWYLAYRHPETFAAIAPICGWVVWDNPWRARFDQVVPPGIPDPLKDFAKKVREIPTWIFHGEEDSTVPVERSREVFEALRAIGSAATYTELPGIGHNAWDAAYGSTAFTTWLFAQHRNP